MKKLLRGSSVRTLIANTAIMYDRTTAKIPIMQDGSSPFSDLLLKLNTTDITTPAVD